MSDPLEEFRNAICASGITPPARIVPDGKIHRFACNGSKRDDAGWYVFHANGGVPAGAFGCWRNDINLTWCAASESTLTPEERAAYDQFVQDAQRERDIEQQRRYDEAAEQARKLWENADAAPDDHGYLLKKNVKSYGLKCTDSGHLLVPVRIGGRIRSLQVINADGEKRFLPGGQVAGGYFAIGGAAGGDTIYLVEGYAPGATVHAATGGAVFVGFNDKNLLPVAKTLRDKLPGAEIVICADDDYRTENNPGLTRAGEAAAQVGARVAVPEFGDDRPEKATDFNDLQAHLGLDRVRECLHGAADAPKAEVKPEAEWPEPKPLPDGLPSVDAFSNEFLPEKLAPWVDDISSQMQCPPEYVAIPAVIALGALIGRRIGIKPQEHTDWLEVPNLWGFIVGRPGMLKSPAMNEALRPLRALEAAASQEHEVELVSYNAEKRAFELKKSAGESLAKTALKKGGTYNFDPGDGGAAGQALPDQ
jgi:putative DNA primase/helicase